MTLPLDFLLCGFVLIFLGNEFQCWSGRLDFKALLEDLLLFSSKPAILFESYFSLPPNQCICVYLDFLKLCFDCRQGCFINLTIDLDSSLQSPTWPDLEIVSPFLAVREGDFHHFLAQLHLLFNERFENV